MGLPIHVEPYAHYRADERPRRFELDGVEYRIYARERERRTPDERCFLVRAAGDRYEIHYHEDRDEWTLEASYGGASLFARSQVEIRTLDPSIARRVRGRILGCEECHPDEAALPLEWLILDELQSGPDVEFLLNAPLACPQCGAPIAESTLVNYGDMR